MSVLGSTPCHPSAATPCLIDGVLAGGTKSGYSFAATASGGPPAYGYYVTAVPPNFNQTGINSFCSSEDALIHADSTGALSGSDAACKALPALGGGGSGAGSGGSGGGGNNGDGNGNGNNGNGNGNGGDSGSNGGGNGK